MKKFKTFADLKAAFQTAVEGTPQLKRGVVWCHKCGHSEAVDSAGCLSSGWPQHCGETMSLDSPEEHNAAKT